MQFVDWSATVPARDPKYPPINKLGDVTVEVRPQACGTAVHRAVQSQCCRTPSRSPAHPQLPLPHPAEPRHLIPPHTFELQEYSPDRRAYEDARKPYFFSDPACRDMYRNHITAVRCAAPPFACCLVLRPVCCCTLLHKQPSVGDILWACERCA